MQVQCHCESKQVYHLLACGCPILVQVCAEYQYGN